MANVFNRKTKQYLKSVNTPDYPIADWIINPKAIPDCDSKYIIVKDDDIREMTIAEKAVVDYVEPQSITELKAAKHAAVSNEYRNHILNKYTTEEQIYVTLGLRTTDDLDTMKSFIASCLNEKTACYNRIDLCATKEELDITEAVLPEISTTITEKS